MKKTALLLSFLALAIFALSMQKKITAIHSKQSIITDTLPVYAIMKDSVVFEKSEIEPSVNAREWIKHLEKMLSPVVEYASIKGMKPGEYTVLVRFLVEKDGSVSDAQALSNPGYGLAKGAVRAVMTGPEWNPGKSFGKPVRSYHTQPITFVISK